MWRKGNPGALLGMQIVEATLADSMAFPRKSKNGSALGPSDSISGDLSEETQNTNLKEYMHPCVHCSIIYNSHDLKAAQVFISK